MLRRGLSNRPTGAVALLLLGASYLLNLGQTNDPQDFLAKTLFGSPIQNGMIFVQKTGAAIDHVFLSCGQRLERECRSIKGRDKKRMLIVRVNSSATVLCPPSPAERLELRESQY